MAGQGHSVLGIDISPQEIRVVEARGSGMAARIVRAGAVPTPRGALDGDRIAFPDAVGETLRGLINRMGVGTREAVMGVGSQSVITRVLDIPRVPENEIRMVIEGELAHYQILREGTGAFDYLRLNDPERGDDANPQVLLMAAEEKTVLGFKETAERAGLSLEALEPVLLGIYRAAYAQIHAQPSAVCLSISNARSEIAIVDHGNIRLYRRVDIGADDLVAGRKAGGASWAQEREPVERVLLGGDDEPPAPLPEAPSGGAINNASAGNLATELQRSLDYYRREYPQATTVSRVIIATNDPQVEPLADWIHQALRIDVIVAEPPITIGTGRAIASQLEGAEGLRFLAATGLAMHGLPGMPPAIPSFDLTVRPYEDLAVSSARRTFTAALAASLLVAAVGVVTGLTLSRNANNLEHKVTAKRLELGGKQLENQQRINTLEMQQQQLRALKLEGYPFPRIMDAIASAVDAEAGLTEVGLDRSGRLTVSGEASNEKAIIKTREALNLCPYFVNTSLDSFEWTTSGNSRLLKFQISSQLAGTSYPAGAGASGAVPGT